MRKSFKRLRALLRFYIDFPEEFSPEYSKQIQQFGVMLSTLRESFVNIHIFEQISASSTLISERKIKSVKEKLLDKNKVIIERGFFDVQASQSIQRFARELEQQIVRIEIDRPSHHQIVSQLIDSYDQAFDCYRIIGINSAAEEFHELRKKLKRLYYQFDYVRYVHPRFFRLKTYHLNKLTDQLGEDHDLYMFSIEIKQEDYELTPSEAEILENQVQHLREINLLKLHPRLKQFFNEPPEFFIQRMETIFKIHPI
jgi:CHAD domain-containing protein